MRHHSPRGGNTKKRNENRREWQVIMDMDEGGLDGANIARFDLVNSAIISHLHLMPFMIEVKVKDRQERNGVANRNFARTCHWWKRIITPV